MTGEVESGQRALESLVSRFPPLTVQGSRWWWQIGLSANAKDKRISSELPALLSDMERANRRTAHYQGDYRDPLVLQLRKLGVESIYAWVTTDAGAQGRVTISPGAYGGWEWGGAATDAWLAEFLASHRGINKVVKLRSVSKASQWHLVIVLDPRSQAGTGIPLQESWTPLPALEPPEPLTHLWLLPMPRDWPGLHWSRGNGWSVLGASGLAASPQLRAPDYDHEHQAVLLPTVPSLFRRMPDNQRKNDARR